jgi:ethanolamine ammonia-lyase small subunit
MSQISKEIFDKIRTRFSNVTIGDKDGNVTLDSDKGAFFEFDYKDRGNVVLNLQDDSIKIYFNNDMISEMDSEQSDNWYAWLRNMRKYSHANMLNFEVKNVDKQRLNRKDFEYLVKNSGQQEEIAMESKMYGGKKKSYQDLNGAKMIVKHARTVDEEKRGARSRNIDAVYIENDQGERFKFPNTYLPAARAMTRHISNGGYPNDERGTHILDIMKEMMDLRTFSRKTKRIEYTEDAKEIIGDATDRYYGLKNTLEGMKKQTGYENYFENWSPDQIEVDENDLEDLKIKLTREVFDDSLTDTLTNVGKASKMGKQKRMEDEEERMGSEAQSLKQFAASDDPLRLFPNEESDAELRTYQQFLKNSNMPVPKRNAAMVQRIMVELANRLTDDSLAGGLTRLDMDNKSDKSVAFAIAMKYLKGEVEIQQPKAKKDLYGKDKKVESWDEFESAVESVLDEEPNEGNEFTAALAQAKKDGKDEFEVDGKKYKVKEDDGVNEELSDDQFEDTMNHHKEMEGFHVDKATVAKEEGNEKALQDHKDAARQHTKAMHALSRQDKDAMEKSKTATAMSKQLEQVKEGAMSDLNQHIGEMIADGASNEEIKKMHPMVKDSDIDSIRSEMDESVQFEEVQEVDEASDMIAKMKAMAGVGSGAKSNHGIREGEAGYQITPRSIVAREMRKLQDLSK